MDKINIAHLRVVKGSGGGPEKTILLSAEGIDSTRFHITAVYIGEKNDRDYGVIDKVKGRNIDYVQLWERSRFDLRILTQLIRILKKRSVSILHTHDYKSDFLGILAGRFMPLKLVSTVHGWIGNSARERFYNRADRKILRRFSKVIAVSSDIREKLIVGGVRENNIDVIHNAIDTDDFRRNPAAGDIRAEVGIPENAPVAGFAGRLSREKDLPVLFMAVKRLLNDIPELRLIIAGDGPERGFLEEYCRRIRLGEKVFFLGQRKDIKRVYQTMDVFVLTSLTEGIPNVILEAMSMEVPVASTCVGGVGEIIEHNATGVLAESGNADSVYCCIKKLLTDSGYRKRIVLNGRRHVCMKFGFKARMKAVEGIYDSLSFPLPQRGRGSG